MKIAIFTDTFLPSVNGVVTSTLNLVKGLASRGHRIWIICPKIPGTHREFSYPNVTVVRISSIPSMLYPGLRITSLISPKIIRLVKHNDIQLLHFTVTIGLGFQAINISKKLNIPLVGTFHTFFADTQYLKHAHLDYKSFEEMAWKFSNWFYKHCDLITTCADYTKRDMIRNGCADNIKVISNGINTNIFDNKDAPKMKKRYNPKGNILLFVGRIAYEKNIEYLLDCFGLVEKAMPDTKLLLVGDGPQRTEVAEKIKDMKLEGKVIMLGNIPHHRFVTSGILGATDLFVTASVTENQPMTILEAQANGIPCIGVKAKGVPDLIKNNRNGFTVPVGNKKAFAAAVVKILGDDKLQKRLRKGTLRMIKRHDIGYVIDEWEKTYNRLIESNKRKKRK
ncbi:MAG: glycosyltransferase [archaeon]